MEKEKPINWATGRKNDKVTLTLEEITNVLLDCLSSNPQTQIDVLEFQQQHGFKTMPSREQALEWLHHLHPNANRT